MSWMETHDFVTILGYYSLFFLSCETTIIVDIYNLIDNLP